MVDESGITTKSHFEAKDSAPQTLPATTKFGRNGRRGWLIRSAIDLVYPPRCTVCGVSMEATEALVCGACRRQLAPTGYLQCRRCGAETSITNDAVDCARCRRERYRFERVICLGRYRDALRDAVLRMKRVSDEPLTMQMSRLLVSQRGDELIGLEAQVVVPIPMHWTRRLVRGVNSAELLASGVAKSLGLPLAARGLVRTRRTKKLAELSREERKRALRDAFAVGPRCDFRDARVLLVDDVLTTGTTCDTAARALRRAGASAVFAAVIARSYPGE